MGGVVEDDCPTVKSRCRALLKRHGFGGRFLPLLSLQKRIIRSVFALLKSAGGCTLALAAHGGTFHHSSRALTTEMPLPVQTAGHLVARHCRTCRRRASTVSTPFPGPTCRCGDGCPVGDAAAVVG